MRSVLLLAAALVPGVPAPAVAAIRGDDAVLANLDDDGRRCRAVFDEPRPKGLSPTLPRFTTRAKTAAALARCVDAGDDRVNGRHDADDLARVTVTPTGGRASVRLDGPGRVFVKRGRGWSRGATRLEVDLRRKVTLGVEARRLPGVAGFDGTLTLRVGTSTHRLRVAPFIPDDATRAPGEVIAERPDDERALKQRTSWMSPMLAAIVRRRNAVQDAYVRRLRAALNGRARLTRVDDDTAWTQDEFQPGRATANGRTMRVLLRAPDNSGQDASGRHLFTERLGPGVAIVQLAAASRDRRLNPANGMGNLEALPGGRAIVGARMDANVRALLDDPIELDTSWLSVGHVDEVISVVPAAGPRGWAVAIADPRLGLATLRTAPADAPVRAGTTVVDQDGNVQPAPSATAAALLAGAHGVVAATEQAATHVDAMVARLLADAHLSEADLIRLPVLFASPAASERASTTGLVAWTGNPANGVPLDRTLLVPAPHGPVAAGRDLFRDAATDALTARGITPAWVDTFPYPHAYDGEIHCTVNVLGRL